MSKPNTTPLLNGKAASTTGAPTINGKAALPKSRPGIGPITVKPIPTIQSHAQDNCPHKQGLSGPEIISQIPVVGLPNYVARWDPERPEKSLADLGIRCLKPMVSPFGNGHVVPPGQIHMVMRDGQQLALLPGKHAWRFMSCRLKPYYLQSVLTFGTGVEGVQDFTGGCKLTIGPNQVGYLYNVPEDAIGSASGSIADVQVSREMGRGVMLLPPGIWLVRAPVMVADERFEVKTDANARGNFVQTLNIPGMSAKPRLMYVPYNHSAMFIDGNSVQICDQGFHWASPGIEIAGPWPQYEQRFTYEVEAKTLDNMIINIEAECWIQMASPEVYVKVAGKAMMPSSFVEDKVRARIKQHVAQIHALGSTIKKTPPKVPGVSRNGSSVSNGGAGPAEGMLLLDTPPTAPLDLGEDLLITQPAASEVNEDEDVMHRMKNIIHEVRGFIDGRDDQQESLAIQAQEMIGKAGLQVISVAALMVRLPDNISDQITEANELTIQAQSEQGINQARAEQHIAEKLNEIRKKKVDRDEETRDAENQVNVQRSKARLAEAEEFAKRQAKKAEQKVEQSLEMQALEHKMVREQKRIEADMVVLQKEKELLAMQEELEEKRWVLAQKQQRRDNIAADIEAYKVTVLARADREKVNQQTLLDSIMDKLGKPMEGSKIVNFIGGGGEGSTDGAAGEGAGMVRALAPQLLMVKELMGAASSLDPNASSLPCV